MQKIILTTFTLLLLCGPGSVLAIESIEVQALLPGMVVVKIDGQRRTIKVNQTSPEGVRLVSADSKKARLAYDGKEKDYRLGNTVSMSFAVPRSHREQLFANDRGMFMAPGSINGQPVKFLVDTGATTVALSEPQARRLNIPYRLEGKQTFTSTASGVAGAWHIKLKSVTLGSLRQQNVDAVVVQGTHPTMPLLGMTFLGHLKVQKEGNAMVLEQKAGGTN